MYEIGNKSFLMYLIFCLNLEVTKPICTGYVNRGYLALSKDKLLKKQCDF